MTQTPKFAQACSLTLALAAPLLGQLASISEPFSASPQVLLEESRRFQPTGKHANALLLQEDRYRFDEEGRAEASDWTIYRVTTKDKDTWDGVSAVWSPWREKRPTIRGRVITPDGAVHEFNPTTIEEAGIPAFDREIYSDRKLLRGPLPSIVEGAVVETLIKREESNPMFGAGAVRQIYLCGDAPRRETRIIIEYPSRLPLRYVVRLAPELQPRKSMSGGRVTLVFETGPSDPAEARPASLPSDVPLWPSVTFATGESWSMVARQFGKAVDEQISGADLRDSLPPVSKEASREQIAGAMLARLHENVRYTGVEFGEASWVPRKPSETLQRGFGDCKDKATVLIAMLRAAGMDARLALLNTGPGPDIEPEIPGLGMFDHAIVYVPGKPDLWIDATAAWARAGELPPPDQGRYALIVGEGTSGLLHTPTADAASNRIQRTREFFLPPAGKARVVETTETFGAIGAVLRSFYGPADEEQLRKYLESYGEVAYLSKKLSRVDRALANDLSRPFSLTTEYLEAGRGVVDRAVAAVWIRREALFQRLPEWLRQTPAEEAKGRVEDVELSEPLTLEWKYRMHPPAGFQLRELPPPETRHLGLATYSHTFALDQDGTVTGTLHFDTGPRRMTGRDAEHLRDGVIELSKAQPLVLYFDQTGEKLLAAGKVGEALAEFRKLAAAEPREAIHRTRIANALLAAGIGEAARKEAREAVVLDPSSALAHATLAWTLTHDLVGRQFEKGFDAQGAIAAYKEAKELDPENVEIRGNLAILLEHNAGGERYGKGADLDQAIAEYRALLKLPASEGLLDNLLIACLRAGRFEVLKEYLAESMPQDEARWGLNLAVWAVVHSPAEAVSMANRSIPDEPKRVTALAKAGLILMQCRIYSKVSELYTAAARGGKSSGGLLTQAQQVAKMRRWEELEIRLDTPQNAVKKMLLLMIAGESGGVYEALSHYHKEKGNTLEEAREVKKSRREIGAAAVGGLSTAVMADILLAIVDYAAEGDDQSGYRVKADLFGSILTVFVVKEAGEYRVLEMLDKSDSTGEYIGYELLARLEAGRLAEARQLLDWVREDIKPAGGDDPLAGPLLPRFWHKGQSGSATDVKQAAAALLAESKVTAADAVPILKTELLRAGSAVNGQKLQLALAVAYQSTTQAEELLDLSRTLARQNLASDRAFSMTVAALGQLGRWDDMKAAAALRLKTNPRDPLAIRVCLQAALEQSDLETGRRQEEILRQMSQLTPADLNNLAWEALVAGKVDQKALDTIQEALTQTQSRPESGVLHTAASLYAETGKSVEARELLLQCMKLQGLDEPDSPVWYVLGRLAENYGETAAAREMYARVTKPEEPSSLRSSSYALAQRRLATPTKATQP